MYILSSTDRMFRSIRTLQCGWKPGSKPIQLYVRLSLRPLGQQAYLWVREFLRYYVVTAAAVWLHFYTLSATRVLNSFEELCIMWAAADNSFTRVLNPHGGPYILSYIYIYIYIYIKLHITQNTQHHKISFSYLYIYIHTYQCMRVCVCDCMHVWVRVCFNTYIYIYVYITKQTFHICTYTYIYMVYLISFQTFLYRHLKLS